MDRERIKAEIEKCETGAYGEGPLWLYLLGWADWMRELELLEMNGKRNHEGNR